MLVSKCKKYFLNVYFYVNKDDELILKKKKNVGNMAINDALFTLTNVYELITEFLQNHPMYTRFFEIFSQV